MPTDEERREVAARLREQKTWDICTGFEYCIGDICDAVFVDDGDLNDMFRLQTTLADLIEPKPERTCTLRSRYTSLYCYECSECGKGMKPEWAYCPRCGAKAVD